MTSIAFTDLAADFIGAGLSGTSTDAFGVPVAAGFFVDPVLVFKDGFESLGSNIVLVSARGAAGKSRTATELAFRTEAPLWRLERDAAVSRAALPLKLNSYLSQVDALASIDASGRQPALFVDSLDEARARVSGQSWDEFLDSVSDAAARGLRIVLFGRDRTLEEVWVKLADAGQEVSWLEVSHFPPESQRAYIDARVRDRDSEADIDDQQYVRARDTILAALAGSVDDSTAETFVGYAPVLDAVAELLRREKNHYKLMQEFESESGGSRHVEVLRKVLVGLLERDQRKLAPLASDLGLDEAAIYTPAEQLVWLWHDLTGTPVPDLGAISDSAKRHDYQIKVRQFLDDHPFRAERNWASAVFEAFAAAERLDQGVPTSTLIEVGSHSGLLFDFVASASTDDMLLVDEGQFAALHSSILSGESAGSAAMVSASSIGGDEFEGVMEVSRPSGAISLSFSLVSERTGELALVGPLEALTLTTSESIRIPPTANGRVIGPDLFLRCGALSIEGADARFARAAPDTGGDVVEVRVEVTSSSVSVPPVISVHPLPDSFEIAVPETTSLVYPWVQYRASLPTEDEIDVRSRAIRFLSKLQSLARTHGHRDGRATFYMKLQGRQPLKSEQLRAVLDVLVSSGAVRLDGELVFLTDQADEHRFSGKGMTGQRTIEQEWDYWGPIVSAIERVLG
ncbi:hypothetical protein [Leucobacter sp. wl10]|uniref:hypothetical protein n=1 Tax=Leucobacter sp. wl10 TaxID=2304677 RepID=UPI0013C2CAD7|nr:hypothetical protein [Leucobacter sp. wl10]